MRGRRTGRDGVAVYYLNVQPAGTQLDHEPSCQRTEMNSSNFPFLQAHHSEEGVHEFISKISDGMYDKFSKTFVHVICFSRNVANN